MGDESTFSDPIHVIAQRKVSERLMKILDTSKLNEKERLVIDLRF